MHTEDNFRDLVSGSGYPMFIVTATADGERAGCLVGFVTQASIRPARLIVMLSKANHTWRVAQRADCLVVHFLHQRNHDLAILFGEQTGDEVDKFAACDWREGPAREAVLTGTRGWLTGTVLDRYDVGDHIAHLIDVTAAYTDTAATPLSNQAVADMQPGHPA